jgi:hypothetical protein
MDLVPYLWLNGNKFDLPREPPGSNFGEQAGFFIF